ncbi:MAG: NAAT family transporter [Gemmatimonadales bacterium]|nr:MAG: NAAT family transporter [Gemmatimonadales bacterium]
MIPEGLITFGLLSLTSLLAITNPLTAAPVYLALTEGQAPRSRARTLRMAVLTGLVVLVIFALLGGAIFQVFGITIDAFRIAGGVIIFGIAMDMLQAKRSRVKSTQEEEDEGMGKEEVGITPLGIPMIVGPGAITTVMVLAGDALTPVYFVVLFLAILLVLGSIYGVLSAAPYLTQLLGTTGVNVLTRIMGLLLAVIAVQFMVDGIRAIAIDILTTTG